MITNSDSFFLLIPKIQPSPAQHNGFDRFTTEVPCCITSQTTDTQLTILNKGQNLIMEATQKLTKKWTIMHIKKPAMILN